MIFNTSLADLKQAKFFYAFLTLIICLGVLIGIGSYTFFYAEGFSYFSENPRACVNCHIMNTEYSSWLASGHHHVATCNDCHLPKYGFRKYLAKARNGWNHSLAFTLENFPEPIQIGNVNKELLQDNCVRCHSVLVHNITDDPKAHAIDDSQNHNNHTHIQQKEQSEISCVQCHRRVGHRN